MKHITRFLFLISPALYISSAQATTSVSLEMHTSTTSLSPSNSIKASSTSVAAAAQAETRQINALTQGLKDPDAQTRAQAAAGLQPFGARVKNTAPMLAGLLLDRGAGLEAARTLSAVDPNYSVSSDTLHRLVKRAKTPVERERVRTGWTTSCEFQTYALNVLAALGPAAHAAIPDIVRLSHRPCIHEEVVNTLDQLGTPDASQMAAIANGIQDHDPEIRQTAIEYLSKVAEPNEASVKMLGRAMNDENSGVRLSALEALDDIHPEGEGRLPLLAGFMKDPSPDVRQRALYMVGQLGPNALAAVPLLRSALKDPLSVITLTSAKILASIDPQDEELIDTLIQFSKRKGSGESIQAAELLESLHIHNARIDAALEPYRTQQALSSRLSHALSDLSPEQLAENARTLKVDQLHIASGLQGDQPMHVAKRFSAQIKRVYCWTEISISSAPASLIHRWYRNGKLEHESFLEVTKPQTNVWSTSAIRPGDWKVDVIPAGSKDPLATAVFTVTRNK